MMVILLVVQKKLSKLLLIILVTFSYSVVQAQDADNPWQFSFAVSAVDLDADSETEFGEFFDRIKYLQCDKHGLDKEGDDTCDKLQRRYPAWKFDDRVYVGVVTRDKMAQLLKQENEYAKAKKKSLLQ